MNVLVIDVGGTQVKLLVKGQKREREFVAEPAVKRDSSMNHLISCYRKGKPGA